MELIRAKVLGFCMGVRRAVELAEAEANNSGGMRVYTFGPLIHNPRVLADLQYRGVEIVNEPPQDSKCRIIIRAHGISPAVEKKLRENGCRVVDATCAKVKASQLKAEKLSRAGYSLFLAGEAGHAEIEGIMGYALAGNSPFCTVVGSADEAGRAAVELYEINKNAKAALLGQTTICEEEYLKIGEAIKKYFPDLEVVMSICTATADRQQALRELLTQADAVIIAGGKESANALRLLAIARESGKPSVLVENAQEIPSDFRFYEKVGLCSGASTPDSLINEIELEFLR